MLTRRCIKSTPVQFTSEMQAKIEEYVSLHGNAIGTHYTNTQALHTNYIHTYIHTVHYTESVAINSIVCELLGFIITPEHCGCPSLPAPSYTGLHAFEISSLYFELSCCEHLESLSK